MATLAVLRSQYHEVLCRELLGYYPKSSTSNITHKADSAVADVGRRISLILGLPPAKALAPRPFINYQFAELTERFIRHCLSAMAHLMPGNWIVSSKGVPPATDLFGVSGNLTELQRILVCHPQLRDALETCGVITPDIVIAHMPEPDEVINSGGEFVAQDEQVARFAPLRETNQQKPILRATISCRWTMPSDQVQRARAEVVNLIRASGGNTLRTVVVTFEPSPTRLASIAVGASDIDCAYHVALPELVRAAAEVGNEAYVEQLQELVDGRRLRDISDLPLDLAA